MKSMIKLIADSHLLHIIAVLALLTSCMPDEEDYSLGLTPEAAFTITDISTPEKMNTYVLTSTTNDAFLYQWDFDNGEIHTGGKTDTAYYDTKGTYTVKLTVANAGGQSTVEQTIVVEEDATAKGEDLVAGGDMEDESAWTVTNVGLDPTTTEFTDGILKFSNGNDAAQTNIGVWQAIEVEAGMQYQLSASVDDSGSSGSWIEFYLGKAAPVDGTDYTDGKTAIGSMVSFEESGTIYLMIKVGSWDGNLGPDGVKIDDVKLVEILEPLVEGDDIMQGGAMTSDDFWTVMSTGGTATTTEFTDNGLKFSNTENSNIAVWQTLEVTAGQQYKFSAHVQGSGATNSWFEVYFGKTEPVEGSDYSDGAYTGLNTWAGCATAAFEGDLAILGCNDEHGTGAKGMISFEETGTVYFVIKAGSSGGTLGTDGITIRDVKLVEMN